MKRCYLVIAILFVNSVVKAEIHTFLFQDVIKSSGVGAINLYKPASSSVAVDGLLLEAFRQDNQGSLVFAVDVNEASDGSENADSQGLAIKSAVLALTIDGVEYIYTNVLTRTQVFLMEEGATERQLYPSLIGVAGSALTSPHMKSELTGTSIDSTLKFMVDRDLSNATKASLTINLLNTEKSLGDPESFYDYSNGYEQVALLTAQDVSYLESLARGVAYAPMVILDGEPQSLQWTYYPSSDSYYVAAFEDLYPTRGDYDFNDLVVAYQVKVGAGNNGNVSIIRGNGFLISRGADYDHDFYLRINLPEEAVGSYSILFYGMESEVAADGFPKNYQFSGAVNLLLAEKIKSSFYDGNSTYVNTLAEQAIIKGPRFEFDLTLDTGLPIELGVQAPFDAFIYVHDTQYEIHRNGYSSVLAHSVNNSNGHTEFLDSGGFPFSLILNEGWMPPLAGVDMGIAYPDLLEHLDSKGKNKQTWYINPDASKIKSIPFVSWQW